MLCSRHPREEHLSVLLAQAFTTEARSAVELLFAHAAQSM